MNKNILIVDDESAIRNMIKLALKQNGFDYQEAGTAKEAESIIYAHTPDLILLDWMMPGLSGIDFLRRIRRHPDLEGLPVIMLTAKTEEGDKIQGLDAGADDYLCKPFSVMELMARIRALLRRSEGNISELKLDGLVLNKVSQRVQINGESVNLGPTEYKLLKFFMENPERVYNRQQLLNHVWGMNVYLEERTVDVHIRRLRKSMHSGYDQYIQTVRGSGYRFSQQN